MTTTNTIHSLLYHFQRHTHDLLVTLTHYADSIHCVDARNAPLQFRVLHGDSAAGIHHISLLNKIILNLLWNIGELGVIQFASSYFDRRHITVDIPLPRICIVHTDSTEQLHTRIAVAFKVTITLFLCLRLFPNDSVLHSNLIGTDHDTIGKGILSQHGLG